MREVFRLTVYGPPVPQPRQKHRAIKQGNGRVGVQNYLEKNHPVQTFKENIVAAAQVAGLPKELLDGALVLEADFYFPRPGNLMRKKDPEERVPHTKRPDTDNLCKSLEDALTQVLWRDDCQVQKLIASKWYVEKAGRPRTEFILYVNE